MEVVNPGSDSTAVGKVPGRKLVGADRTLAVLAELGTHPDGIALEALAEAVSSPKPTVHRALVALRRAGFAAQDGRGRYILGNEFLRLAFTHHEGRPDHVRVSSTLKQLAAAYGETAHYAVLEGYEVVYRSKEDPQKGSVRLTSVVGGRNPAHCTAVGKLLLAYSLTDRSQIAQWVGDRTLVRPTNKTLTTIEELNDELEKIRALGYSVDDQENEPGINCLAVPAYLTTPSEPSGAISISALAYRMPLDDLVGEYTAIRELVDASIQGKLDGSVL